MPLEIRNPVKIFWEKNGRIGTHANYISMSVESDGTEVPKTISEVDFIRMYARHEPALRAYARLILSDWNSVDDVLQDASVTMWENRQQLQGMSGFLPWGKVIVRHKCFNSIAKRKRDKLVLDKKVLELIVNEEEVEPIADEAIRIQNSLATCLGKLSPERRELVLAPYRGAGEVKRLAERVSKTPNSLYKVIGRIREKLSQCVKEKMRLGLP